MSSFLFPAGLALLLALPIILWLHLRKRRPRRVLVPSLSPWLQLLSQTPPRRHRPPPSLLLFLHLMVALLLGLAAAGLRMPGGEDAAGDRVILLDLTQSMAAEGRWEAARSRASALIDSTSGTVGVIALTDAPRVLVGRDPHGRNALDAIASMRPDAAFTRLDHGLKLASAIAEPGAEIVLISDGGSTSRDEAEAMGIRLEQIGAPEDNLAITSLAARESGGLSRLFARVENFSTSEREVTMRLDVDGSTIEERVESLAPDQPFEAVWALPAAAREAQLVLDVDDALAWDDRAGVSLRPSPLRVQMTGESSALRRALAAMPDASVSPVGLGKLKADGSVDASIFVGRAPSSLPPGGSILVNLIEDETLALGENPISGRIASTGDHPLVRGLDLRGVVLEGLRDPRLPEWADPVLVAEGRLAIMAGSRESGRQVVLAFDPDEGELGDRVAFPVLIARMLEWVAPAHDPRSSMVWTGSAAESDLREASRGPEGDASTAESGAEPSNLEPDSGSDPGADGRKPTSPRTDGDATVADDFERRGGRPLWPALALIALLLLPTEAALRSGWFSKAPTRRSTARGPS